MPPAATCSNPTTPSSGNRGRSFRAGRPGRRGPGGPRRAPGLDARRVAASSPPRQRGALLRRLGDLIAGGRRTWPRSRCATTASSIAEMSAPAHLHPAVVPLLRRSGRQDRGRGPSARQDRLLQLHALRAARRRRRHHAVELPAAADRMEAAPGAGRRQHHRHQAVGVHVGVDAGVREARRGGGFPARRRQRRHRLRQGSRCRRWSSIRSSEDCLHRLGRHRAGHLRDGRARPQARRRWSSAESRRTSCSTMPISKTP